MKPLSGRVALVAGATRGAGRGIARGLAEAGALVYCTGRSVRGQPSAYKRPETIEETVEMIAAGGGRPIALPVGHTIGTGLPTPIGRVDRGDRPVRRPLDSHAGQGAHNEP